MTLKKGQSGLPKVGGEKTQKNKSGGSGLGEKKEKSNNKEKKKKKKRIERYKTTQFCFS